MLHVMSTEIHTSRCSQAFSILAVLCEKSDCTELSNIALGIARCCSARQCMKCLCWQIQSLLPSSICLLAHKLLASVVCLLLLN